jgi:hypothetical protein
MTPEEFRSVKIGDNIWCSEAFHEDSYIPIDLCERGRVESSEYSKSRFVVFPGRYYSLEVYPEFAHKTKLECIEHKISEHQKKIAALEKFKTSDIYEE